MPPSSAGLTPKGGVVNNRRRAMAFSRTLQWDQPAPTQPIRAVTLRASTHQLRIFARDPQGSHGPTLTLQRDLARVRKSIERLMTAYQEDLLPLDELRGRMPDLRQRERAMQAELQSIATQAQDRTSYLRLAETLSAFLSRLRSSAKALDITERQRIVRLLVKEILVAEETIIIRH